MAYKSGCACQARPQLSSPAETCYAVVMPPSPSPVSTVRLQACEWTSAVSVRDGPCLTALAPVLRICTPAACLWTSAHPDLILQRGNRYHHLATNSHKQARFPHAVRWYRFYHIRNPREMIPSVRASSIEPILAHRETLRLMAIGAHGCSTTLVVSCSNVFPMRCSTPDLLARARP